MINYTTPTITLTVEGVDLTGQDVYVSLEQKPAELTKTGSDLTITTETHEQVTDTVIELTLTQEESAMFKPNNQVWLQVNWISQTGRRAATEIKSFPALVNLLDEVLPNAN